MFIAHKKVIKQQPYISYWYSWYDVVKFQCDSFEQNTFSL